MPRYKYTALTQQGQIERGFWSAINRSDLDAQLTHRNLYLVKCWWLPPIRISGSRANRLLLEHFFVSLQMLLQTGIPLPEALEIMSESGSRVLSDLCGQLSRQLSSGATLADSVKTVQPPFGHLYPAMIALGEQTGNLESILGEIVESIRWQSDMRERIKRQLFYPMLVAVTISALIVFLMIQVVPSLLEFTASIGQDLPAYSLALVDTAEFMKRNGMYLLPIVTLAPLVLGILYRSSRTCRRFIQRCALGCILIGPLLHRIALARFSHHMSVLSRAHLDLPASLQTSRSLTSNLVFQSAFERTRIGLLSGDTLADALSRSAVFPVTFTRVVKVGESAGELAKVFDHLSQIYQREAKASTEFIQQTLNPILMSGLGGIMMWLVVSIFSPLYEAVSMVGL